MGGLGASQVIPVFQEHDPDPDPEAQAQKSQNGIQVAAGEAKHGPPGTPEKNKGTDHGKNTQDKTNHGR